MSVTGFMYNINAAKKIGEIELENGIEGTQSWHHRFRNSAYVYIGGLNPGLTEGDIVIVFSQFGEIVDVNVIRDKATGKSKGFCFICYEDQRSTVLAVDNMNGFKVLGRTIRVDHVDKYKAPKILDEENLDENGDATLKEYHATGAEGAGLGEYNVVKSQKKMDEINSARTQNKISFKREDEDEAWAKAFESGLKTLELENKKKKKKKDGKKGKKGLKADLKEIKQMEKEAKRLKEEAKKAKEESKNRKTDSSKRVKKEATSSEDSDDSSDSASDSASTAEPKAKKRK